MEAPVLATGKVLYSHSGCSWNHIEAASTRIFFYKISALLQYGYITTIDNRNDVGVLGEWKDIAVDPYSYAGFAITSGMQSLLL